MEKIDVHNTKNAYEMARKKLLSEKNILPENIKAIMKFLDDSAIGKTARLKARIKTVGLRGRLKNLYLLKTIGQFYQKDFKTLTVKDVENLIHALDKDTIKKKSGQKYSEQTKSNIKKVFILLLSWLFKERSKKFYEMTYWIDTKFKKKTIINLDEKEVRDLIDKCNTIKQRILICALFDGGFRAEEFLNIRNCDIKLVEGNAPYYRFRVRTEFSKTEGREIPMFWSESYEIITAWINSKTESTGQEEQFFNGTYDGMLRIFGKLGKRINKSINPQMLRKSSAQYYANKGYNEFQINKRYGWSANSDVGGKYYIEQAKINIEDNKQIKEYENAKLGELREQMKRQAEYNNLKEKEIEEIKQQRIKDLEMFQDLFISKFEDLEKEGNPQKMVNFVKKIQTLKN